MKLSELLSLIDLCVPPQSIVFDTARIRKRVLEPLVCAFIMAARATYLGFGMYIIPGEVIGAK